MNKKGEGYVTTCVIILAICMLLSVFISFVTVVCVVKITKRNVRTVLENYVMTTSIEIYDSVKQGEDDVAALDTETFTRSLCSYCDLEYSPSCLYAYDDRENLKYRVSYPKLTFTEENRLKVKADCYMYIPVKLCGANIFNVSVPISVKAKFDPKYIPG